MKKVFSNPIFTFILGAIIFGGMGTVIAVNISSSMVEYDNTSSGLEATTVEGAINELYIDASKKIATNSFGQAQYSELLTKMNSLKTQTISLNKGKYLVSYIISYAGSNNSKTYSDNTTEISSALTCNNCTKQILSGKYLSSGGKGYGSANIYLTNDHIIEYVEVLSNTDTLSISYGWESYAPLILSFHVIPIN